MYAATGGNVALIQELLTLGQDPTFAVKDGSTAVEYARYSENPEAVRYLTSIAESAKKPASNRGADSR